MHSGAASSWGQGSATADFAWEGPVLSLALQSTRAGHGVMPPLGLGFCSSYPQGMVAEEAGSAQIPEGACLSLQCRDATQALYSSSRGKERGQEAISQSLG